MKAVNEGTLCRRRLTTESPFYCYLEEGHSGECAFNRKYWTFLPAEEVIASLEAELSTLRKKAELADEAKNFYEYQRPFSNEDNLFWEHWVNRYYEVLEGMPKP